ncbi:MAG: hypothetical protein P8Y99_02345 [Calditrichaceae bacterium]
MFIQTSQDFRCLYVCNLVINPDNIAYTTNADGESIIYQSHITYRIVAIQFGLSPDGFIYIVNDVIN